METAEFSVCGVKREKKMSLEKEKDKGSGIWFEGGEMKARNRGKCRRDKGKCLALCPTV